MADAAAEPAPTNGPPITVANGAGLNAYKAGVEDAVSHIATQTAVGGSVQGLSIATSNALTVGSLVLVFGLVVTGVATFRMRSATPGQVLRLYGTIMAITLTCFLVVSGVDNSGIAAGIGFLGTIVGYLLGRPTQAPDPSSADARKTAS